MRVTIFIPLLIWIIDWFLLESRGVCHGVGRNANQKSKLQKRINYHPLFMSECSLWIDVGKRPCMAMFKIEINSCASVLKRILDSGVLNRPKGTTSINRNNNKTRSSGALPVVRSIKLTREITKGGCQCPLAYL